MALEGSTGEKEVFKGLAPEQCWGGGRWIPYRAVSPHQQLHTAAVWRKGWRAGRR